MRRAVLVLNPAAGQAARLEGALGGIVALLAEHGYAADPLPTTPSPGSATQIARRAAEGGAELVIACGGDGTVHEVVQGLALTRSALGVLPLGTANALARNLGLPLAPLCALETLLTFTPRLLPLGQVQTPAGTCWFAVMAGCGPDGALVQAMLQAAGQKRRFGRAAYYGKAGRLFLTRRWPAFRVDFRRANTDAWETAEAVALLASRVPDLGGLFGALTPRAGLTDPELRLYLLSAPAQLSMPAWMVAGRVGVPNPWLAEVDAVEARCTAAGDAPVYAQADAELLGQLPLTLRMVPGALWLMMPPR